MRGALYRSIVFGLGVLIFLAPCGDAAGLAGGGAGGTKSCRKIVLEGEVNAGREWRAAIGAGWVFRLVPVGGSYSGWDLVVDRADGGGYPDALLLATPPYRSLNEREIATTYGLRAQDAIAWGPRRFRFLTSAKDLAKGRMWYRAASGTSGGADRDRATKERATAGLLAMTESASSGEFQVLDSRLVAGTADAPAFAEDWSARLRQVPHTYVQVSGQKAGGRGELRWMRFKATLWLPRDWAAPTGVAGEIGSCPQ